MWYHPGAHALGRRDVIGAWIVCLCAALVFLGLPLIVGRPIEAHPPNADFQLGGVLCRLDPSRSPLEAPSLALSDVYRVARS